MKKMLNNTILKLILISSLLILVSCREGNSDFLKIKKAVTQFNGKIISIGIESDSLYIENGGGNPTEYVDRFGQRIESIVDEEIVLISFCKNKTEYSVLPMRNDNGYTLANPNKIKLDKNERLIFEAHGSYFTCRKK